MPLIHGHVDKKKKKDPKSRVVRLTFYVIMVSTTNVIKGEYKGSVCAHSRTVCACTSGGQRSMSSTLLYHSAHFSQALKIWEFSWISWMASPWDPLISIQCWNYGYHLQLFSWVLGSSSHPHAFTANTSHTKPQPKPTFCNSGFPAFVPFPFCGGTDNDSQD